MGFGAMKYIVVVVWQGKIESCETYNSFVAAHKEYTKEIKRAKEKDDVVLFDSEGYVLNRLNEL